MTTYRLYHYENNGWQGIAVSKTDENGTNWVLFEPEEAYPTKEETAEYYGEELKAAVIDRIRKMYADNFIEQRDLYDRLEGLNDCVVPDWDGQTAPELNWDESLDLITEQEVTE